MFHMPPPPPISADDKIICVDYAVIKILIMFQLKFMFLSVQNVSQAYDKTINVLHCNFIH